MVNSLGVSPIDSILRFILSEIFWRKNWLKSPFTYHQLVGHILQSLVWNISILSETRDCQPVRQRLDSGAGRETCETCALVSAAQLSSGRGGVNISPTDTHSLYLATGHIPLLQLHKSYY